MTRKYTLIATITALLFAGTAGAGWQQFPVEGASNEAFALSAVGSAVTDWSLVSQNAVSVGKPPGSAEVLHALVHAAIYDAVVAIEGGYEPFASAPPVTRPADVSAAVAAAARAVLVARVPAQAASVEQQYAAFLGSVPDGTAETNGVAVGQAAAAGVLALRAGDGYDNSVVYQPPALGPGVWEPTASTPPVDVKLKQVRPFTFASPSRFRASRPMELGSAEYARDFDEVKALGRIDSPNRTAEQTQTVQFWAENTFIQWSRSLRNLALARGLNAVQSARMLALVHVATADSMIGCFEAKYHYLYWRPIHAIRRADTDGNPATTPDPTWTPLLNVNHPEYPSGHSCYTSGVANGLKAFFGTDKVDLVVESTVTKTTRSYSRLGDVQEDVRGARIWGGLHFRNTVLKGEELARQTVNHVVSGFFRPDLLGSVGVAKQLSLTTSRGATFKRIRAGWYRLVVKDLSARDNFYLRGSGLQRKTGLAYRGTVEWGVELIAGRTYRYGSEGSGARERTFRAVAPTT